ncbi:hypothetical protein V500_02151 [Pseudogymnoascus sp. VKM F-4518 (FW-2643)]|nr:hypothetical protein V500_02151 [Pseudogymnoascus sp. VKM F-4518 (FW-2643)]
MSIATKQHGRNGLDSPHSRIPNIPFPPGQQYTAQRIDFEAMSDEQTQDPAYAAYGDPAIEQNPNWSLIPTEYTASSRKREPRTTLACEACRAAKMKCTDPKPCKGCTEKNIDCKYEQRVPNRSEILEVRVKKLEANIYKRFDDLNKRFDDFDSKLELLINALTVATKSDNTSETIAAANISSNESAIPIGHTTGADHILKWPAVVNLVGEILTDDMDSLRCEYRRGAILLHECGEGGSFTYKDPMVYALESPNSGTDSFVEGRHSSAGGNPSMPAKSPLHCNENKFRRGIDISGLPQLDEVEHLTTTYMGVLNAMHPIITKKEVHRLSMDFQKYINEMERDQPPHIIAAFASNESTSSKRKRSPTVTTPHHLWLRSMDAAIFFLILALGKVCEHPGKIPDVLPDYEAASRESFHTWKLPSPSLQEKRNIDVIPGLAHFAIAMDILDSDMSGDSLQSVHVCLLASLYHSQLGRVLQSHAFVKKAGDALSIILKPDIVAELEVSRSEILSLESIMPWPHLRMAVDNGEVTLKQMECYLGQIALRKHLNYIHRSLYGPNKDKEYQLAKLNKNEKARPEITVIAENLQSVMQFSTDLIWQDRDPASDDILEALFRAKMFGALVITYRHYLRMVLNNKYSESGVANENISKHIMELAGRCIQAMIDSTQAFWHVKGDRLTVTNVWGTCHAQWGHVIALHAAYVHPSLRDFIDPYELCEVTIRVRKFLVSVAQPSSALANDIKILDYVVEKSGILAAVQLKEIIATVDTC